MCDRPTKVTAVVKKYQHVDNGGLEFRLIMEQWGEDDNITHVLEIEDGYFGYSQHILRFHMLDAKALRDFATAFNKMADIVAKLAG